MNIYCMHCGLGTMYEIKPPKFCSHCSKSFTSVAVSSTNTPSPAAAPRNNPAPEPPAAENTPRRPVRRPIQAPPDDFIAVDGLDIGEELVLDLAFAKKPKEKFGELYYSKTSGSTDPIRDIDRRKVSKKKFLEQFAKEGGAGGRTNNTIGDE